MKTDTITVRVVNKAEIDADSADLTVSIEGSSLFSGAEAVTKAKELRALIESLKAVGIDEHRVKLRRVDVSSQSFALIKSSSAKYVVAIKSVSVELLATVFGVIASHKGAKLYSMLWNYGKLNETRSRLRLEGIADALRQAKLDAAALKVEVRGIHRLAEENRGRDYNYEQVDFMSSSAEAGTTSYQPELGNSTTVTLELRAEFRVGPIPDTDMPRLATSNPTAGTGPDRSSPA